MSYIVDIPSLTGLAVELACVAVVKVILNNSDVVRSCMVIGPYGSPLKSVVQRVLSRGLVEATRRDVSENWFPLEQFSTVVRPRASDNGHTTAGGVRDTARKLIFGAIHLAAKTSVELTPAKVTAGSNRDIIHQHFAANDLYTKINEPKSMATTDVIVGIDTDYYLTNPDLVLGYGLPAIFYSFNPLAVAGIDGDCRFRIGENQVVYQVDGGGDWKHQVWNWCGVGEFILSDARGRTYFEATKFWILACLGIRKRVIHKVAFARPWAVAPHRIVVWCMPQSTYWTWWFGSDLNSARRLERVVYQDADRPGWNRLLTHPVGHEPPVISIGREMNDLHVELPVTQFNLVMGCASAQAVTSRLLSLRVTDPSTVALVGQYFTNAKTVLQTDISYIPRQAVVPSVHWAPPNWAEEPVTTARNYSRPLVTQPALAPMIRRWETLAHSLEVRVVHVANQVKPPVKYMSLAREFVDQLVPVPFMGVPFDLVDTAEMMDKPKQVSDFRLIVDTLDMTPRALIESFIKNEATMKTPRIISAWNDFRWILNVSSFEFKLKKMVYDTDANQHWWYPGKAPAQIATDLQDYVEATGGNVVESDYSNMDGMTSAAVQEAVPFAIALRYFKPEFHEAIRTYQRQILFAPARSKTFGFQYEAGVGVKSGSPTTTNNNTIVSAFHEYCAIRRVYPELKPDEVMLMLGPKAGDDGVTRRCLSKALTKVVEDFGMKIKIENYDHERGLCFLGRVFPDILQTTTSMQDPLRTWRKLHMTFRDRAIPLADAATDRVQGYLTTDAFTPIISEYCNLVLRHYAPLANSHGKRAARKDSRRELPYWMTENGSWPQDPLDRELMLDCISARVGLDRADLETFCAKLTTSADLTTFAPLMVDDVNPHDETLDDDCQPDRKWVDDRIVTKHYRKVQQNVANAATGRIPPSNQCKEDGHRGMAQQPNVASQPQASVRPPSNGEMPRVNQRSREQRDRRPQGQADIPQRSMRRGNSRGRRSTGRDQGTPSTAGTPNLPTNRQAHSNRGRQAQTTISPVTPNNRPTTRNGNLNGPSYLETDL